VPGAGVAQYPDFGFPAFMWRIPIMDSANCTYLKGFGDACQSDCFGIGRNADHAAPDAAWLASGGLGCCKHATPAELRCPGGLFQRHSEAPALLRRRLLLLPGPQESPCLCAGKAR
jgi:hypothetical protein